MSAIRSSVRPVSSKQKWGTILKPEFGLGYQKLTQYEIDQTVERLYFVPTTKQRVDDRQKKEMSRKNIQSMLDRVAQTEEIKVPDSDRRMSSSIYKDMGVVSSYAWKGYN
ncbi:hypothetical protein SNE40_011731 [Patella caerulea]|uniref:Uncharacterized protein n=1 Tax=Patella caerulea TaxID=87958 RepID=A0AAN8JST4_PATCE